MSPRSLEGFAEPLGAFASEVLRWNRRINLISRQETEETLRDLLEQCRDGFLALWPRLLAWGWGQDVAGFPWTYWDLGSGGGLPGIVWHHEMAVLEARVQTILVEPRAKRAWFLERLAQSGHWPSFRVLQGRWGEDHGSFEKPPGAGNHLISLKALHLSDPEVLGGLVATVSPAQGLVVGCEVVVARYYPSEQEMDPVLVQHLALPSPGETVVGGGQEFTLEGSEILRWARPGPRTASLVVVRYRVG